MEQANEPERAALKHKRRFSRFFKAFIVLFALFFAAGFFTLGSFKNTGKSFSYTSGDGNVAVFNLNMADGQSKLVAVYINVGNIYTAPGEDVTFTVKRSASSLTKPSSSLGTATIGNLYSAKKKGKEAGNFNWVPVAEDKSVTAYKISVSATADFDLNEIVCIGDDGKLIPLSVDTEYSQGFTTQKKELGYAIDAQGSFKKSGASYYNFAPEEAYYMTSVHTVLGGGEVKGNSVYTVDGDFNSLATLLLLPSVAIFGNSTFALRFTPFLATCATLIFVYLLGGLLFKDDKYGFIFALIFAIGGLATTVGRLGAPHALLACFLVASLYFMYRFFSKGISSEKTVKGGLNVLFSGLFAAFAMAMNTLAAIPVAGILVLFGFGLRRQKKAYAYESEKLAAKGAEVGIAAETDGETTAEKEVSEDVQSIRNDEEGNVVVASGEDGPTAVWYEKKGREEKSASLSGKEERKLKAQYKYKNKVAWGFAILSFLVATFVFLLLASVVSYTAYVKAYDADPTNPSLRYGTLLWKGISAPFKISNITQFTEYNALNVAGWLLPLKAATVYNGVLDVGSSRYLAWNVSMNSAVAVVALISFAFTTVSVVAELFTENRGSRANRRNRRVWLVLFAGLALSMLAQAFVKNSSMVQSSLFGVFYVGFIPLAVRMAQPETARSKADGRAKLSAADIILICCIAIFVAFFALSVPSAYGFEIPQKAAKYMFWWSNIATNGYFRP